jgi:eukaryotic-like serine/threonine-protein kinase
MDAATFGPYRVTGLIGRGGMGVVYAAQHTLLGRPAAIKVLLPELSQKQDAVQRFFNEARAATAIRHPSIVEIHDFGWNAEGAAFIVMEYLEGETLAQRSERARLRWQVALGIVRQIAGALAAAHAKGIVHRDLKPENIFLVPDPEVPGGERIKLLDFGIAKLAGDASTTPQVTRTGAVMGTPTYMAPEQCRGVVVDHRADLYALGCVLFHLCTGRPPFLGEGTGDVLAAHIHVPAPTLASLNVKVPSAVELVVKRLLAKSPEQRVQSADELIRAIDTLSTESGGTGFSANTHRPYVAAASPSMTTLSRAASSQIRSAKLPRQRRTIAVICTVAAAITVVVVALAMREGDSTGSSPPIAATVTEPAAAPRQVAPDPEPAGQAPSSPAAASLAAALPAAASGEPALAAEPVPVPPVADAVPPPPSPSAQVPPAEPAHVPPASSAEAPASDVASDTVEVTLDSVPPDAQVLRDGKAIGKTPFRGTLPRQDRDVRFVIRRAGFVDRAVVVRADKPIAERVELRAAPRPPKRNRDRSVNPFAD